MRVGDADRDAVAEALREHHAAGRLDVAELGERLDAALAARTVDDLAAVTADLPDPVGPPEAAGHVPGWPAADRARRPARADHHPAARRPRPLVLLAAGLGTCWLLSGLAWSAFALTHAGSWAAGSTGPGGHAGHGPGPWPLLIVLALVFVVVRRRRRGAARAALGTGPREPRRHAGPRAW